ncbi:MAG: NUDIX domain-containing protein [Methanomassiliicoccaceae archaeon]|nr:NUDIX domain-containing protein [Methanomassiliicoccaceae archaeon]
MNTVYTIAFSGDEFLMVYNPKRNGWEMPGGHVETDENIKEAAEREYLEESGYEIRIISVREIDVCHVCAALLGDRIKEGEFVSMLFSELPDELAFERSEYHDVTDWARSEIKRNGK